MISLGQVAVLNFDIEFADSLSTVPLFHCSTVEVVMVVVIVVVVIIVQVVVVVVVAAAAGGVIVVEK